MFSCISWWTALYTVATYGITSLAFTALTVLGAQGPIKTIWASPFAEWSVVATSTAAFTRLEQEVIIENSCDTKRR